MAPTNHLRPGGRLSTREVQCLRGAARGLTNAEIAAELFLSVDSVRTHMKRAVVKLGARVGGGVPNVTRAHVVGLAYERGLLDRQPERHGDHAGYQRHVRRGEDPRDCPPCTAGERAYRAQRRAARTTTKEQHR